MRVSAFAAAAVLSLAAATARADVLDEVKWDMSLRIESDLRFRLENKTIGPWYGAQGLVAGVERNQNTLGTNLSVSLDKFRAVGSLDLVLFGYQQELQGIGALSETEELQPYRFDVNELYIEASDLLLDGLRIRLGQQIVAWGVADQFNPTNNLNPDDLRDPLLFGRQAGNFMAKVDYWWTDDFSWSAVLVPLFRPALLPVSGALAVSAIDRLPFVDANLRWRVTAEQEASASSLVQYPTVVDDVTILTPAPSFENMQVAFRMAGTIGEQDIALSYYNGRTDFPIPTRNHTTQNESFKGCNPLDPNDCAKGLLETDLTLGYPKMHVFGLNIAGEFNPFKAIDEAINGIGYRFEGAMIVPQESVIRLTNGPLDLGLQQQAEGEYDYDNDGRPGGRRPVVVEDTPFFKWTLGLDYTFGSHVYVNLQWVHGLPDEFGAGDWIFDGAAVRKSDLTVTKEEAALSCALPRDGTTCSREITRPRIADYLVAGIDVHFLEDQALARLFTILDLSGYKRSYFDAASGDRVEEVLPFLDPEGFSAAIYPEFDYNFGNGVELGAGALFLLGKDYTKFGDPASGGSLAFVKAKYTL
jgi:hypothetical protein